MLCRIALYNCYGARILIQFSSSAQPRKSSGRKSQLKKRWRLQYCPIRHLRGGRGGVGGRGRGQIRCIMGDMRVAYSAIRLIGTVLPVLRCD